MEVKDVEDFDENWQANVPCQPEYEFENWRSTYSHISLRTCLSTFVRMFVYTVCEDNTFQLHWNDIIITELVAKLHVWKTYCLPLVTDVCPSLNI